MLWLLILLPFAGSLGAAFLPTKGRNAAGLLAGGITLACSLILLILSVMPAIRKKREEVFVEE